MKKRTVTDPRVNAVAQRVLKAAEDALGNKLDKVILYGSYARDDYDSESDIDFFILADVPQEEASARRRDIRKLLPGIDLEYDIPVSLHVTGSTVFNRYVDSLPYYMNVVREGVVLGE